MKMTVEFRGGSRFDIISREHTIVTDQPREDGEEDAGSRVPLFSRLDSSSLPQVLSLCRHSRLFDSWGPAMAADVVELRRRDKIAKIEELIGRRDGKTTFMRFEHVHEPVHGCKCCLAIPLFETMPVPPASGRSRDPN